MAGNFINFKELHPFQSFVIGGNKALINFGTVLSFCKNSLEATIVPKIGKNQIVRVGEDGFEQKNLLEISSDGVIYLEIKFQDIDAYIQSYIGEWEGVIRSKDYTSFIAKYWPEQSRQNLLTNQGSQGEVEALTEMDLTSFSPLVLDTPPIESVELKFHQTTASFASLADDPDFLYIDDNHIKKVAIAVIKTNNLIQLIFSDYAVSIPFTFRKKFLTDFLEKTNES